VAGARGVILDPNGKQEPSYAWGIGIASSNEAKEYALLQGINFTLKSRLKDLVIIEDSRIITKLLIHQYLPKDS
jgi:ribonuclease HI